MKHVRKKLFKTGAILALPGFVLMMTMLALFEPGTIIDVLVKACAASVLLGMTSLFLGLFTYLPRLYRFILTHKKLGKGYLWLLIILTGGLVVLAFYAAYYFVKLYGYLSINSSDDNDSEGMWSGNPDSVWSEDEADASGVGSYQWWDRYG